MQTTGKHISVNRAVFGQFLAVGFMSLLLIFLTCINYFLYPPVEEESVVKTASSSPEKSSSGYPFPAGPDEKSPDVPVNINEEYVHDGESLLHACFAESLILHKIHEAEKLCIVHADLFSPPPEV